MLEESARGESSLPDGKIIGEVKSEIEKVLEKELGLKKEEIGNRPLVEERIRERVVYEFAKDRLDNSLISKELAEKVRGYTENPELHKDTRIAEKIGVEGVEKLCRLMGYHPTLRDLQKSISQGPDSVWNDPRTKSYVIVEAKSFRSKLKIHYGAKQGTLEWAKESAKGVLRSKKASNLEKDVAKRVLKNIILGKARIETIRVDEKGIKIEKIESLTKENKHEN